ncbi:MAG: pseudouridine-5-phosphate glycosidase [Bacteroidetes bacterium]|nr:pseudouridine-5-phosphate glycosidase [Bacteroidota bacterium]
MIKRSDEVQQAMLDGVPVVALESTLIAHGMPWPVNLETGMQLEEEIRRHGAVPATIAVLDGQFLAGLNPEQLERLARLGTEAVKCSPRDLGAVMTRRQCAATTVAGTLLGARLSGIAVFATGGIGGVHRGASASFDVSADLPELARSPVMVVSAGAKSILDLPATLEYLETLGVPVVGFGTDEFPAFYHRNSGLKLSLRMDDTHTVAGMFRVRQQLGLPQGMLIANPVPETAEARFAPIQAATDQALREAAAKDIHGQALTPFLLARIAALSQGESLQANVALALNNARLGAELATALAAAGVRS